MARIAGWSISGQSQANKPYQLKKAAQSGKQHIIESLDVTFSAAPGASIFVQMVNPDVSPNTIYWSGYVGGTALNAKTWPSGLSIPPGAGVEVQMPAGGGAVIGSINLAGYTQ
jgi:hypothetical protein